MPERQRFILASRSPRRVELLRAAGYAFETDPADIDESDVPAGKTPRQIAEHLALAKAQAVARRHPDAVVLGSDTVVAVGDRLFGKAESADEARAMLTALGGTRQSVITGVAVIVPGRPEPDVRSAESVVAMREMTREELEAYVSGGHWRGKAGAYGIQDHDPENDPFVRLVSGELTNVVGLPIELTRQMLEQAGVRPTVAAR